MHGGKCNDLDALLRNGLSLPTDYTVRNKRLTRSWCLYRNKNKNKTKKAGLISTQIGYARSAENPKEFS